MRSTQRENITSAEVRDAAAAAAAAPAAEEPMQHVHVWPRHCIEETLRGLQRRELEKKRKKENVDRSGHVRDEDERLPPVA